MPYSDYNSAAAAYFANLDYDTDGSVTRCRTFIAACRALVLLLPAETEHSGQSSARLKLSPELIEKMLSQAKDWLGQHSTAAQDNATSTYGDFTNFRGGNCL